MDASTAFDDIGHSDVARDLLKDYLIGPLATSGKTKKGRESRLAAPKCDIGAWYMASSAMVTKL
jgi:cytochrome b involved in lipid metabolism